jgi:tetratricopeptide (TPR) repeat protein
VVTAALAILSCKAAPDEETLLLYARASAVYSEGRFDDTVRMLSGARSFPPALVLRGKAAYFSGDLETAEKSLRRALALRPSAAEASIYMIRILRERGREREAETLVEAVLTDDPSDVRALRLAADISREKGPSGEAPAAAFLDRAAEASAETALVFLDRARFRWAAGNGEGALEDLRRARALLPWDTPLFRAIENLESRILEVRR